MRHVRCRNSIALFLLLSTMVFPVSCTCEGQVKGQEQQTLRKQSTLKFKTEEWNFGEIEELDGRVEHIFIFTNKGKETVVLERVTTSCGCTVPEYSQKPIKPNESGEVKVVFDPRGRPGNVSQMVYITSGGGKNYDVLTVRGYVNPRKRTVEEDYPNDIGGGLRINRTNLYFGRIEHGDAIGMTVGYVNNSDKAIKIRFNIHQQNGLFHIDAPKRIEPHKRGDISIICDATAVKDIYGTQRVKIIPVVDDVAFKDHINASVVVTEAFANESQENFPKALFEPSYYVFVDMEKGNKEVVKHTFLLKNKGAALLKVRSVEGEGGVSSTLKSGTVVEPNGSVEFECKFAPPVNSEGITTGRLLVVTNDPMRPVREIKLVINIK